MGTALDTINPESGDFISDFPANEQTFRGAVQTLISTEHYEGASGNDRHKMQVSTNEAALEAAISSPLSGNFGFRVGSAAAANAPRILGASFHDGSAWRHGYFVPTGTILQCAFNPATPPEGFLACNGAEVAQATYADLYAVIGSAFANQNGVTSPSGANFRVPLIGGHHVVGLTAGKTGQAGWHQNVSGQHDMFVTGTYSGSARLVYLVRITATGTPDTFAWSDDAGATWTTGVSVAATNALSNGLTLDWDATAGHSVGDTWSFVAEPALATVGGTLGIDAWSLKLSEMTEGTVGTAAAGASYTIREFGAGPLPGFAADAHENVPHALVLGHVIKT